MYQTKCYAFILDANFHLHKADKTQICQFNGKFCGK